MTVGLCVRL